MNHDETHHADLTPEQREGISQALDEIRTSAALLRKYEAEAKRAQERAEECRRRGHLAAAQLFGLLEQLPGSTYHAPDAVTYHAVTRGVRHPDGTMTVEKSIHATTGRITTRLEISAERDARDHYQKEVAGNYQDTTPEPKPAKGDYITVDGYHQDRRDGEALAAAYRARHKNPKIEEPTSYGWLTEHGHLKARIIEAGPAIRPQPKWPKGQEPDFISNIIGGFVDGTNRAHQAPQRFDPGQPTHFNAARKIAGIWRWYALEDPTT